MPRTLIAADANAVKTSLAQQAGHAALQQLHIFTRGRGLLQVGAVCFPPYSADAPVTHCAVVVQHAQPHVEHSCCMARCCKTLLLLLQLVGPSLADINAWAIRPT